MVSVEERFWSKVDKSGDCWLWTKALDPAGYAFIGIDGQGVRAHRWAWESVNGPIPEGLEIDHLCRVRHCVNPDHLEPVTHAENMIRAAEARIPPTHCIRGHEFTPENTMTPPSGGRKCRACKNLLNKTWRQRALEAEQTLDRVTAGPALYLIRNSKTGEWFMGSISGDAEIWAKNIAMSVVYSSSEQGPTYGLPKDGEWVEFRAALTPEGSQ